MASNRGLLKAHYEQQKKILEEIRQKQLQIAAKVLSDATEALEEIKINKTATPEMLTAAEIKLKEAQLNFTDVQYAVAVGYEQDLKKLHQSTQEQLVHPSPLADEISASTDLSNYDRFDTFDPEGHRCVGFYRVNGRHFALWKSEKDHDLYQGTTRVSPQYDELALKTMYDKDYFGDKATLQVGIPDRGAAEVTRRQNISQLQVSEWKEAGIDVKGKRVIEVGGGSGYLSEEVKNQGGKPVNVELCEERCQACEQRGIETYNGFLQIGVANDADHLAFNSADVVACYDLLEHVVNPHQGFIQSVNAVLKTGGYLCVRVPEGTEPTLHLVDHVNHFSFASLKHFLEHFGFEYHERPEGKKYSGTFHEPATSFHTDLPGDTVKKAEHPIETRRIENMTVYFKKIKDCDFTVLDKFKISTPKLKA